METRTLYKTDGSEPETALFVAGMNAFILGYPVEDLENLIFDDSFAENHFYDGYFSYRDLKDPNKDLTGYDKLIVPPNGVNTRFEDLVKELINTGMFYVDNEIIDYPTYENDHAYLQSSVIVKHKEYYIDIQIQIFETVYYSGEYSNMWVFSVADVLTAPFEKVLPNNVLNQDTLELRYEEGGCYSPDGVIFVETIDYEETKESSAIGGHPLSTIVKCIRKIVKRELKYFPVKRRLKLPTTH